MLESLIVLRCDFDLTHKEAETLFSTWADIGRWQCAYANIRVRGRKMGASLSSLTISKESLAGAPRRQLSDLWEKPDWADVSLVAD